MADVARMLVMLGVALVVVLVLVILFNLAVQPS